MDAELLLEQLVDILGMCDISFERRNLDDDELIIKSGLCEIESRRVLIVDKRLGIERQVKLVLQTLREQGLSDRYIAPAIRDLLEGPEG